MCIVLQSLDTLRPEIQHLQSQVGIHHPREFQEKLQQRKEQGEIPKTRHRLLKIQETERLHLQTRTERRTSDKHRRGIPGLHRILQESADGLCEEGKIRPRLGFIPQRQEKEHDRSVSGCDKEIRKVKIRRFRQSEDLRIGVSESGKVQIRGGRTELHPQISARTTDRENTRHGGQHRIRQDRKAERLDHIPRLPELAPGELALRTCRGLNIQHLQKDRRLRRED